MERLGAHDRTHHARRRASRRTSERLPSQTACIKGSKLALTVVFSSRNCSLWKWEACTYVHLFSMTWQCVIIVILPYLFLSDPRAPLLNQSIESTTHLRGDCYIYLVTQVPPCTLGAACDVYFALVLVDRTCQFLRSFVRQPGHAPLAVDYNGNLCLPA